MDVQISNHGVILISPVIHLPGHKSLVLTLDLLTFVVQLVDTLHVLVLVHYSTLERKAILKQRFVYKVVVFVITDFAK